MFLVLGVPYYWRNGFGVKDGFSNVDFACGDMIQPWSVGAFKSAAEVESAKEVDLIREDKAWCKKQKVEYQRVIWPGFAWSNWNGGQKNQIPRDGGKFIWAQAKTAEEKLGVGKTTLFIAMFDEYDEGTAIAKAAENQMQIPTDQYFLTLDADGYNLTSDFYLATAGNITQYYRSIIKAEEEE